MSLKHRAVVGAIWTVLTSVGGRAIGLIGTLALTRFLAPAVYGEVSIATVIVMVTNAFVALGFGQYLVANPDAGTKTAFHATVYHVGAGTVVLAALIPLAPVLAPVFEAPRLPEYMPALVVAVWVARLGYMPSRILARDMRFRVLGLKTLLSEVAYAGVAISLAAAGWGGAAVMWGFVARMVLGAIILTLAVEREQWLKPSRLDWAITRKLLDFGVPMYLAHVMHFVSMRGDNLVIGGVFGPAAAGEYNLAYNLADIPASQVGEHIGDVLLPSFAKMDSDEWRQKALVRATGLLALVVFPLAVGLAAISESLVRAVFDPRWYRIAPMLLILSVLSIFRPLGWLVAAYLQAMQRTRTLFLVEALKTGAILGFVYGLGQIGLLWGCAGVGLGFGVNALASLWVVRRADGVPFLRLASPAVRPLLACAPMVGAVIGTRVWVGPLDGAWLQVFLELCAGAVVYVAAAFVVAPRPSKELLSLLLGVVRRRRGSAGEGDDAAADAADDVPKQEDAEPGH